MATHKSLKVTFWSRVRDLVKGILLYGSVNWSRASDGLKPPRLSPKERKLAAPSLQPEIVRPRENPQNSLIKAQPKKVQPKKWDITAGAIVSDPFLTDDGTQQPFPRRHHADSPAPSISEDDAGHHDPHGESELVREEIASADNDLVIVRRRKRHRNQGLLPRRTPRTAVQYVGHKPGLLSRWFGLK